MDPYYVPDSILGALQASSSALTCSMRLELLSVFSLPSGQTRLGLSGMCDLKGLELFWPFQTHTICATKMEALV